jgi:hypothetical protein
MAIAGIAAAASAVGSALTSTTAIAAASVATAAASGYMAYSQTESQKAQQELYNENLQKEAIRQYKELDEVEKDVIYESHAESLQAQREYMQARSTIELQAAATGTYGSAVDLAITDLNVGLGNRMSEITYNRDAQLDQVTSQAEAIQAGTAASYDTTIQQPSWYSGLSTGVSTGYRVYSAGTNLSESLKESKRAV